MKKVLLPFSFLLLLGCVPKKTNYEIIVNRWLNRNIEFPSSLSCNVHGKDSLLAADFKILFFLDSIDCVCKLNLYQYQALIEKCQQDSLNVVPIILIATSDFEKLNEEIVSRNFSYPIFYDFDNEFNKINELPPYLFQTFLLNEENKVQLIGSPIGNSKMWELYKKTITQSQ